MADEVVWSLIMASTTLHDLSISRQPESGYSQPARAVAPAPPAIGNRQILTVSIVISLMSALVATVSFAAGRMTANDRLPASRVESPQQAVPEQIILVEPVKPAVPALVPQRAAAGRGDLYFQISAVDRGMANVTIEYLRRLGFPASATPGDTQGIFRVLVGPLQDPAETAKWKGELMAAGFQPFTRRVAASTSTSQP